MGSATPLPPAEKRVPGWDDAVTVSISESATGRAMALARQLPLSGHRGHRAQGHPFTLGVARGSPAHRALSDGLCVGEAHAPGCEAAASAESATVTAPLEGPAGEVLGCVTLSLAHPAALEQRPLVLSAERQAALRAGPGSEPSLPADPPGTAVVLAHLAREAATLLSCVLVRGGGRDALSAAGGPRAARAWYNPETPGPSLPRGASGRSSDGPSDGRRPSSDGRRVSSDGRRVSSDGRRVSGESGKHLRATGNDDIRAGRVLGFRDLLAGREEADEPNSPSHWHNAFLGAPPRAAGPHSGATAGGRRMVPSSHASGRQSEDGPRPERPSRRPSDRGPRRASNDWVYGRPAHPHAGPHDPGAHVPSGMTSGGGNTAGDLVVCQGGGLDAAPTDGLWSPREGLGALTLVTEIPVQAHDRMSLGSLARSSLPDGRGSSCQSHAGGRAPTRRRGWQLWEHSGAGPRLPAEPGRPARHEWIEQRPSLTPTRRASTLAPAAPWDAAAPAPAGRAPRGEGRLRRLVGSLVRAVRGRSGDGRGTGADGKGRAARRGGQRHTHAGVVVPAGAGLAPDLDSSELQSAGQGSRSTREQGACAASGPRGQAPSGRGGKASEPPGCVASPAPGGAPDNSHSLFRTPRGDTAASGGWGAATPSSSLRRLPMSVRIGDPGQAAPGEHRASRPFLSGSSPSATRISAVAGADGDGSRGTGCEGALFASPRGVMSAGSTQPSRPSAVHANP